MATRRPQRDLEPVPEIPWSEWLPRFRKQYRIRERPAHADHVTIIGPNGTGKTVLAAEIANLRKFVVWLGTKPRDDELAAIGRRYGYRRDRERDRTGVLPATPNVARGERLMIWPRYRSQRDQPAQRRVFGQVLDDAFSVGGWHIVIDEAPYLIDDLRLEPELRQHLRMGRAMASGLIICAQRPRGIPLLCISAASHLLIFGTNDDEDLKRLRGMNGVNGDEVREVVGSLGRDYRFLHVNTGTGELCVSRFDRRG